LPTRISISKIQRANTYKKKTFFSIKKEADIKKKRGHLLRYMLLYRKYYTENKNKFKVSDLRTRYI